MEDHAYGASGDGTAGPPGPIERHLASREKMLVSQFARWIADSHGSEAMGEVAGRLLERFSEDTLADLMIVADRMPAGEAPGWVRQRHDDAVGEFGAALRSAIPAALRHQAAQVLQLRLLEAERRLNEALVRWPDSR